MRIGIYILMALFVTTAVLRAEDGDAPQAPSAEPAGEPQADQPQQPRQAEANAAADVGEAPLSEAPDELDEQARARQPAASAPMQAPAGAAVHTTERIAPSAERMDQPAAMREILEHRLHRLLEPPPPDTDPAKIQRQLDVLNDNAERLAEVAETDKAKLWAYNVALSGRYARVNRFAQSPDVDAELSRLRAAARRVKALDTPAAAAIGDFWLMTADLFDINRLALPLVERQRQAAQVLDEYLDRHPRGPASEQVATAVKRLSAARGLNDSAEAEAQSPEPDAEDDAMRQTPEPDHPGDAETAAPADQRTNESTD